VRMVSCGKWAPLKRTAIVSLPLFAPSIVEGNHVVVQ
jgi:hypothetical protein